VISFCCIIYYAIRKKILQYAWVNKLASRCPVAYGLGCGGGCGFSGACLDSPGIPVYSIRIMKTEVLSFAGPCLRIAILMGVVLSGVQILQAQTSPNSGSSVSPDKTVSATPQEIKNLVSELGHDEYSKREDATRRLTALGEIVAPYLQDAVKSTDPEVRIRARGIMLKIGAADIDKVDPENFQMVDTLLTPVMSSEHANLVTIVKMGRNAAPSLVRICREGQGAKPIYSMIALTRIADPRSFPALAEMFQDTRINNAMFGYVATIKDPRMLFHLIKAWQQHGENASPELRKQVARMAGTELGDDPKKWMEWYMDKYSDKLK